MLTPAMGAHYAPLDTVPLDTRVQSGHEDIIEADPSQWGFDVPLGETTRGFESQPPVDFMVGMGCGGQGVPETEVLVQLG